MAMSWALLQPGEGMASCPEALAKILWKRVPGSADATVGQRARFLGSRFGQGKATFCNARFPLVQTYQCIIAACAGLAV